MPNVQLYLVAAILGLVAMGAAGWKGYSLGSDHVRAEYAARDIAQANEAAAALKATQEKYRAIEQEQAASLAKVSGDYQKRLTDAQAKTALALNAIRSGAVRLRDPYAKPETCGSAAAETGTGTGRRDGSKAGELSEEFGALLYSEAARADEYTEQLTACQSVVAADRR